MIPQIGFAEMIILVLLAVIVVGPKDLPKVTRTLGAALGKIRMMASEFTRAFEDMGAETEMAELRAEIEALKAEGSLTEDAFQKDMCELDKMVTQDPLHKDPLDNAPLREGLDIDNPKTGARQSRAGD